jgi:hypothetical protein
VRIALERAGRRDALLLRRAKRKSITAEAGSYGQFLQAAPAPVPRCCAP